jgi:RNA polymerase sigma factor (sigma-70 family)
MPTRADRLLRCVRQIASGAGPELDDAALLRRFLGEHDAAAFEALVARHGPMVLGVCRRVLGNAADAEDACQATFLVLAQRASSVQPAGALAAWLHGVACRVARAARSAGLRRRRRETPAPDLAPPDPRPDPLDELTAREFLLLLDEEIGRLPEVYRLPVICCCLEGRKQEEAAALLGWTPGSVRGRLARGRARLHARLARRGLTLTVALAAVSVCQGVTAAAPASLAARVLASAAGEGSPTATVNALADTALRGMALGKRQLACLLALVVGAATLGAGVFLRPASDGPLAAAPPVVREPGRPGAARPARADLHGDPLPEEAVGRLGTVRFRHGQQVRCVAFWPDGERLVSCSADFTIRLWDRETGKEVRRFDGHKDQVQFVRFTPDGKYLVSAGGGWNRDNRDTSVRLWDVASGKEQRRLVEGNDKQAKTAIDLAPGGKILAFGVKTSIRLLSIPEGRHLGDIPVPPPPGPWRRQDSLAKVVRFSPDGKRLGAVVEFAGVCVFDVTRRKLLWQNRDEPTTSLPYDSGIDFSPDGKLLAAACTVRKPVRLFTADTGKVLRTLAGPVPGAGPLLFMADGKRLLSNGWGEQGLIWDVATGKPAGKLRLTPVHRMSFTPSPDGKTLALAGRQAIQFYDVATGRQLSGPSGANGQVDHIEFLPDGRTVLAGSSWDSDVGARFWDLANGRLLGALDRPAVSVALAPDGKTIAAGFYEGPPVLADAATGKVLRTWKGPPLFLESLVFTRDGRQLIGASWTGKRLHAWDASTGEELPSPGDLPHGAAKHLALSPDGKRLAFAGLDGIVRLWDVVRRKQAGELKGMQGPVLAVAWSPDGREIAAVSAEGKFGFTAGTPDRKVRVWDVATGRERVALAGPEGGSWCVAWSPDGRLIATGGEDNIVRVWERASGQQRFDLKGHAGPVMAVAFTSDGARLLSGSSDTTVLVWDLLVLGKNSRPARAEDLPSLWTALAGEAREADRAMRSLVAAPTLAVGLLRKRLRPVARADKSRLARRLAELDSPEFAAREKAMRELEAMGELAIDGLRRILDGKPSLEVRRRAEALLRRLTDGPLTGDRLRAVRATAVLEHIGSHPARQLLQTLAGGAPGARLTEEARASLARLERRRSTPR